MEKRFQPHFRGPHQYPNCWLATNYFTKMVTFLLHVINSSIGKHFYQYNLNSKKKKRLLPITTYYGEALSTTKVWSKAFLHFEN